MKGHNRSYAGMSGKCQDLVITQMDGMSVARGRVYTNLSKTPKQATVRECTRMMATAFRGCSQTQVEGWKRLGAQMKDKHGRPLPAWQCFSAIWGTLLAIDPTQAITLDAPASVTRPPVLPPLTLDASLVDGTLLLTLTLSSAYSALTVLSAAAPANIGRSYFGKSDFTRLETAASLPAAPLDLSNAYRTVFSDPLPNQKIAVLLTPMTADGFVGEPRMVTANIPPAASSG